MSHVPSDPGPLPDRVAVVIVGAGSTGLLAAQALRSEGVEPVLLLEATSQMEGGTARHAFGLLAPGTHQLPTRIAHPLGEETARRIWQSTRTTLENLCGELEELGIVPVRGGWSMHARSPTELDELRECLKLWKRWNEPIEILRDNHPLGEGIRLPEALQIETSGWLSRLADRLEMNGVPIHVDTPVTSIRSTSSGNQEIRTPRGVVQAEFVLSTSGWQTARIEPSLGKFLLPRRLQTLCTAPLPLLYPGHHTARFGLDVLSQSPDGRLLVGGMGWAAGPELECGLTEPVLHPIVLERQLEWARSLFPDQAVKITSATAVIEAFTSDDLPLVGPLPGCPRRHVATGFAGHGQVLGAAAAHCLAGVISGHRPFDPALDPMRPGRFL